MLLIRCPASWLASRVVALGHLRPEMRFNGLDALIARIKTDIGLAKAALDLPQHAAFQSDSGFR